MHTRHTTDSPHSRRRFLLGTASLGAAAAALGCAATDTRESPDSLPSQPSPPVPTGPAPLPDGLDESNFIVHSRGPWALETRREKTGASVLTAKDHLFVRCNLPLPDPAILENRDRWSFQIDGVQNPASLTVAQLKRLGLDTLTTVLQCSGNGRKFFTHETSGSQWGTGAAGCVVWSGIKVSQVIEALGGAAEGGRYLTTTGGEELPAGIDPMTVVVERSIPIEKGLNDCLLAWEMNGEPLTLSHGGPLRLIVPGYFGCNNIKYVKTMAVTAEPSRAKIMNSGYRWRPIGESGAPEQPSMWQMAVKSWICAPAGVGPVLPGTHQVHGVAFSGGDGVEKVEYSADGQLWQEASFLGPDMGPYAWRMFRFEVNLPEGQTTLYTRATDGTGQAQPEGRQENHRGYGHNGWRDHGVILTATANALAAADEVAATTRSTAPTPGSLPLSEEAQAGRTLFVSDTSPACGTCHTVGEAGTTGSVGPNLDVLKPSREKVESAIRQGVGVMPSFEDSLSTDQIESITTYLLEATRE